MTDSTRIPVARDGVTVAPSPCGEFIILGFLTDGEPIHVALHVTQIQSYMEGLLVEGLQGLQHIHQQKVECRPDGATVN